MNLPQILTGLLQSGLFFTLIGAILALTVLAIQIFALAVMLRFLAFSWRWLWLQEANRERRILALQNHTQAEIDLETPGILRNQRTRWTAVLSALYISPPLIVLTVAFFALRQRAAWIGVTVLVLFWMWTSIVIFFS